jgi:4-alpha-glucanotransferase
VVRLDAGAFLGLNGTFMKAIDFNQRAAGILLHPTSLRSAFGIGDLGPTAHEWVDFVAASGTKLWQILPLGPTGYGDSPYQCFSTFAGNPYLVSPTLLLADGLVTQADLDAYPELPSDFVDFGPVITAKLELLDSAYARFQTIGVGALRAEYEAFRVEHAPWLDDFSLFMALKDTHGGRPWTEWERPLRVFDPEAVAAARRSLAGDIDRHAFRQFMFFRQWMSLRQHANGLGVAIIGDIPIYVASDSADVWANQRRFLLDDEGRSTVVAGVPPDYFSVTGQLWGNPLYDWDQQAAEGYVWWIERIRSTLAMVDIVRIDHFRAFADYWEIPASAPTAETGQWLDGPGHTLFDALRDALGHLPIIAEDLGDLSPAVPALRDQLELPGMKILQFAFDDDETHPFLPHNYPERCVAYTGTHDNQTVTGWWATASTAERDLAMRYLDWDGSYPAPRFLEAVWESPDLFAVAPLQDFLGLDDSGRMNTPGTTSGNWTWRVPEGALSPELAESISDLNARHGR